MVFVLSILHQFNRPLFAASPYEVTKALRRLHVLLRGNKQAAALRDGARSELNLVDRQLDQLPGWMYALSSMTVRTHCSLLSLIAYPSRASKEASLFSCIKWAHLK